MGDSEPAVPAETTGKMDPQASRWKKKYVPNASVDELFTYLVQISETYHSIQGEDKLGRNLKPLEFR